jgi:hypothetical protein
MADEENAAGNFVVLNRGIHNGVKSGKAGARRFL